MAENVDGLLLTTADSILLCSATAWAAGLKQRLQVSTWPAHYLSPAKGLLMMLLDVSLLFWHASNGNHEV